MSALNFGIQGIGAEAALCKTELWKIDGARVRLDRECMSTQGGALGVDHATQCG
jgi:hypothetical protein